ncbi:hypothetical protein SAMN04488104_101817 [Algoriphagus faecimaris]|uniref:Uncharacterized protein n=1 Tax=Algoriphagus faecimaris TaxID=686796 RepID=A0A1G6SRD8_9BACT|nr:hypothetical protein [Algoriphagus faecimaris]SDD18757.1 hypothetical protein SAMN04488104_101817 [Algoriphagus faecimaris]
MLNPDWSKVINNSIEILQKSDNGIVLLDMYNTILTPEEAAFNKVTVTPYNALKFIQQQFSALGFDIYKKENRIKMIALLEEIDRQMNEKRIAKL